MGVWVICVYEAELHCLAVRGVLSSVISSSAQVITESMGEKYLAMKLKDQERAIAMLAGDPQLAGLRQVCVQISCTQPLMPSRCGPDLATVFAVFDAALNAGVSC